MLARLRSSLSFSNVVSVIALVVAVGGGTAYALAGKNSVFSDDIKNGQVKTGDLAKNAVTGAKTKNATILGVDIRNGTVKAADVGDGSIGRSDLSASAKALPLTYVRTMATAAQETVFDGNGIRIQASCEDESGQPHLRAFLTVDVAGVFSSSGVFDQGSGGPGETPFLVTGFNIPAATPVTLNDLEAPVGSKSEAFGTLLYNHPGGVTTLNVASSADDTTDQCRFEGTVISAG